jgi:hypothetical protein
VDSQSTADFCNAMLLQNSNMNVHCNAGKNTTNLVDDLPGYGTVWCGAKIAATILRF